MPAHTLLVMLDSAEPLLVQSWAAEGKLPHLNALLVEGDSLAIENLPGFGNGPFWASVATGVDPSWHGGYYLAQPKPPHYTMETFGRQDFMVAPFWETLDDEGLQTAVLDIPEAPIAEMKHGIEVSDWIVHRRIEPPRSSPPELMNELLRRYGEDPLHGRAELAVRQGMPIDALDAVSKKRIELKTRIGQDLLGQRDWDLFALSFPDPHDIGHLAWHLHDTAGTAPEHPNTRAGAVDPLEVCYRRVDEALGALTASVAPETQVFVVMGPGMQRLVSGKHLIHDVLRALGGRPVTSGTKAKVRRAINAALFSRLVPHQLRRRLLNARRRAGHQARLRSGQRFDAVPHNDDTAALRIAIRGRDPGGSVEPGPEYDRVCSELTERLLALRDASGNRPAIAEVLRTHEYYAGPELQRLPDLLVQWHRDADLERVSSPEVGTIERPEKGPRSGDHTSRGLLLCNRPLARKPDAPIRPEQVTQILCDAVRSAAGVQNG